MAYVKSSYHSAMCKRRSKNPAAGGPCRRATGAGDEGRGALCLGSLCGSDRGREPAGSGAALWDRPADGSEDAGVFGAARVPAEPAAGALWPYREHQIPLPLDRLLNCLFDFRFERWRHLFDARR
jgi:hypothetical protein